MLGFPFEVLNFIGRVRWGEVFCYKGSFSITGELILHQMIAPDDITKLGFGNMFSAFEN